MKPNLPWPPLVGSDRVPRLVVWRDYALTLVAWCVFGWMINGAAQLAFDWFRQPFGQFTFLEAPDWGAIWFRLRNYVEAAALLIVWIAFWAVYRSADLRPTSSREKQPDALDPALLCARYGVSESDLAQWQEERVITVDVAPDGRVSRSGS